MKNSHGRRTISWERMVTGSASVVPEVCASAWHHFEKQQEPYQYRLTLVTHTHILWYFEPYKGGLHSEILISVDLVPFTCSVLQDKFNPERVTGSVHPRDVLKYCYERRSFLIHCTGMLSNSSPILSSETELCVASSRKVKITMLGVVNVYNNT